MQKIKQPGWYATQQTIQVISFFTLHKFFYNIFYFCEHIKEFYKTIKSPCLLYTHQIMLLLYSKSENIFHLLKNILCIFCILYNYIIFNYSTKQTIQVI